MNIVNTNVHRCHDWGTLILPGRGGGQSGADARQPRGGAEAGPLSAGGCEGEGGGDNHAPVMISSPHHKHLTNISFCDNS